MLVSCLLLSSDSMTTWLCPRRAHYASSLLHQNKVTMIHTVRSAGPVLKSYGTVQTAQLRSLLPQQPATSAFLNEPPFKTFPTIYTSSCNIHDVSSPVTLTTYKSRVICGSWCGVGEGSDVQSCDNVPSGQWNPHNLNPQIA